MWPQLGVTATGIWLMAAPAVLGYGVAAAASDRIVGPTMAAIGFVAASAITRGLRWLNLVPGVWLLTGPWLLGASTPAKASSILAGLGGACPRPPRSPRARALRRRLAQPPRS